MGTMKRPITELVRDTRLYFDGGCGTMLQKAGLKPGEVPEEWNLSHADAVIAMHRAYLEAGSRVLTTNTFGANCQKDDAYEAHIKAAVENAKAACAEYPDAYIALDIGPTGKLLEPLGPLSFEDAVSSFAASVRAGVAAGVDLILIETMSDCYETKAAVLAAKETCTLPVFVTCAYGEDGKLMTGATPEAMTAMLEGLHADVIGMNCSLGPDALLPIVRRMRAVCSVPMLVSPNAGLPVVENGKTVYKLTPEAFAESVKAIAECGVSILGGCCGTNPDYIREMIAATKDIPLPVIEDKKITAVSSYTHSVVFGDRPVLIGERINPTGKPKLKEALRTENLDYILNEAIRQEECGVPVLDVNVGLPDIDEPQMLLRVMTALQAVTDLPLQLDSSDSAALERAMRLYNGKPLVNSVSGKEAVMAAVFPLVKKYGGVLIALTLDDTGIPSTAAERIAIAHKIIRRAKEYGIPEKDIIVDPLAMAVSSDGNSARVTLDTVAALTAEGIHTSLGVSNISFGLPRRDILNAAFFAESLQAGLSAAIMNPFADGMMQTYVAHCLLRGLDAGCADYLSYAEAHPLTETVQTVQKETQKKSASADTLCDAITHGLTERAVRLAKEAVTKTAPLSVIETEIIPALNTVGAAFEKKTLYLPQLLGAADAASAAFGVLRSAFDTQESDDTASEKPVILATVQGDIHDIGKNIVRVLLESYGFSVLDLGRDVPPEAVVDTVKKTGCRLVGLSALMTTTVPAMEETIRQLHALPFPVKVVVGGAVLTDTYAKAIGADAYSAEAMQTVRYAQSYYAEIR